MTNRAKGKHLSLSLSVSPLSNSSFQYPHSSLYKTLHTQYELTNDLTCYLQSLSFSINLKLPGSLIFNGYWVCVADMSWDHPVHRYASPLTDPLVWGVSHL